MQALDFAQLATLFSGGQLAIFVFVLLELRNLTASNKSLSEKTDLQGAQIGLLNAKLAHVMGRLKIEDDD